MAATTANGAPPPPFRVAIVGAGAAGLACARSLMDDFGFERDSVVLLEARSEPGGRISHSTTFAPGHAVDLGAEFIHGTTTTLNKLGKRYGLPLHPVFRHAQGDGGPDERPTVCARARTHAHTRTPTHTHTHTHAHTAGRWVRPVLDWLRGAYGGVGQPGPRLHPLKRNPMGDGRVRPCQNRQRQPVAWAVPR